MSLFRSGTALLCGTTVEIRPRLERGAARAAEPCACSCCPDLGAPRSCPELPVLPGVDGELSVPVQLGPGEGAVAADAATAATLVVIAPSAAAGIPCMAVLGRFVEALALSNARAL